MHYAVISVQTMLHEELEEMTDTRGLIIMHAVTCEFCILPVYGR